MKLRSIETHDTRKNNRKHHITSSHLLSFFPQIIFNLIWDNFAFIKQKTHRNSLGKFLGLRLKFFLKIEHSIRIFFLRLQVTKWQNKRYFEQEEQTNLSEK